MKLRVVLAALAALVALPAFAENFRCGKWIINIEMTPNELIDKCGPPTTHESRTEDV